MSGVTCSCCAEPIISNCTIEQCSASGRGAGIGLLGAPNATITRCIIRNNSSSAGLGGGLYAWQSGAAVTGCTLSGNSAKTGGGAYGGAPTTVDLGSRSVSIGLDGGEAITCTFTNFFDVEQHIRQTQAVIHQFLSHRVQLLANHEPDRSRFIRRVPVEYRTAQNLKANQPDPTLMRELRTAFMAVRRLASRQK